MPASRDMTSLEASILSTIRNSASYDLPIQALELREKFHISKRVLENTIESLRVNFNHPIVAKKHKPNGYYLPKSEQERLDGLAPYRRQIETEKKNLAAILSVDLSDYWSNA